MRRESTAWVPVEKAVVTATTMTTARVTVGQTERPQVVPAWRRARPALRHRPTSCQTATTRAGGSEAIVARTASRGVAVSATQAMAAPSTAVTASDRSTVLIQKLRPNP